MTADHWSDYANTDHRSGAWIIGQVAARAEHLEECRGRRRLLALALVAWSAAGGLAVWFFHL